MSDVMLFGVLKMPYEMAMASELSRLQFYQRAQELVARVEAQPPAAQSEQKPLRQMTETDFDFAHDIGQSEQPGHRAVKTYHEGKPVYVSQVAPLQISKTTP